MRALTGVRARFSGRRAPVGEDASAAPAAQAAVEAACDDPKVARFLRAPELVALDMLWGEGRCAPSDPGADDRLANILTLNETHTAAWFGGLGAGPIALAASSGGYVDVFEWRERWRAPTEALVAASREKTRVRVFEMPGFDEAASGRRFDAAVVAYRAGDFEPEADFPGFIRSRLKPGGLVSMIEPVVEEHWSPGAASGCFATPYPGLRTLADWRAALANAGLEARVVEDITGAQTVQIKRGWAHARESLDALIEVSTSVPQIKPILASLAVEAVAAHQRLRALERGDLAVYRFLLSAV